MRPGTLARGWGVAVGVFVGKGVSVGTGVAVDVGGAVSVGGIVGEGVAVGVLDGRCVAVIVGLAATSVAVGVSEPQLAKIKAKSRRHASMTCLSIFISSQMTAGKMTAVQRVQFRLFHMTAVEDMRAARGKAAARRQRIQARRVAGNAHQLFRRLC